MIATTATRPADTRDLLLRAAERILVEQGVHALSVRRVGETAGLNGTLVTYHFGGIGALLAELAERNLAPMVAAWAGLEEAASADAALATWLEPLLLPAAFHPDARALIVLDEIAAHGSAQQSEAVMREMVSAAERVAAALAPHLPALGEAELRMRLRFIAGAALGPPPRTRVAVGAAGPTAAHLLAFARAALDIR